MHCKNNWNDWGGGLSHRNIIVNGDMRVAQRSAGPVAVSDGSNENYQTIDRMRFAFGNSAAGACNISQSTDAPTTLGSQNHIKLMLQLLIQQHLDNRLLIFSIE